MDGRSEKDSLIYYLKGILLLSAGGSLLRGITTKNICLKELHSPAQAPLAKRLGKPSSFYQNSINFIERSRKMFRARGKDRIERALNSRSSPIHICATCKTKHKNNYKLNIAFQDRQHCDMKCALITFP